MAAQHWMEMARSSEDAARWLAQRQCWRSSVSRAYYAAYCAIHAVLVFRRERPPQRGNWPHEALGDLLHTNLETRAPRPWPQGEKHFRGRFNQLIAIRIAADYGPMLTVESDAAKRARHLAGPFVRLAERILNE